MRILRLIPVLALLLVSLFTACNKDASTNSENKNAALKTEIDSLQNAVNIAWDSMIVEDDKKLQYMKRAMEEAVYVLNADEGAKDEISTQIDALKNSRYDKVTMSNSDLIDQFDSATNASIKRVFDYLESYDSTYSVTLISELHAEILEFDDMVIHRRGHYDEPAMSFNKIIKDQKDNLEKLGEPYASLKPYPLFVLNPDL